MAEIESTRQTFVETTSGEGAVRVVVNDAGESGLVPEEPGTLAPSEWLIFHADLPEKNKSYDLWDHNEGSEGVTFPAFEAAAPALVVSSDSDDDGQGVFVIGLDSQGERANEVLTIGGSASATSFLPPLWDMRWISGAPGSRGGFKGTVSATIGGVNSGAILPGQALSKTGFRRVPAGEEWTVVEYSRSLLTKTDLKKPAKIEMWVTRGDFTPAYSVLTMAIDGDNSTSTSAASRPIIENSLIFLSGEARDDDAEMEGFLRFVVRQMPT